MPAVALACAGLLALVAPRAARAWEYPLLPHVQGLAFFPERLNDQDSTSFLLSAYYPDECFQLVDARLVDLEHVSVRIAPATGCTDTVSSWTKGFGLGILAAGIHQLTVHAVVHLPSRDTLVEEITVPYEVVHGVPGPPPPPPPPPVGGDWEGALLLEAEFTPGAPLLGDSVSVSLRGRYPFACGAVTSDSVAGPDHLPVTLHELSSCADTSRTWTRTFALGTPSVGEHWVTVDFHVQWADSVSDRLRFLRYTVTDPNAPPPPPPPPPGDSLAAGLSASHPNPFTEQTTFAVSLADPTMADVAVYDLSGRIVAPIHHGVLPRGTSVLAWNGRRADGSRAPGGIYFYRLVLPHRVANRRVVLLGTP